MFAKNPAAYFEIRSCSFSVKPALLQVLHNSSKLWARKRRKKDLMKRKKSEAAAARDAIKKLPKDKRKAAREKFKQAQKKKYARLNAMMPPSKGLSLPEIKTLLKRMQSMRV